MTFTLTDSQAEELIKSANRLGSLRAAFREAGMVDDYNKGYHILRRFMDKRHYELHGRKHTRIVRRKS